MVSGIIADYILVGLDENKLFLSVRGQKKTSLFPPVSEAKGRPLPVGVLEHCSPTVQPLQIFWVSMTDRSLWHSQVKWTRSGSSSVEPQSLLCLFIAHAYASSHFPSRFCRMKCQFAFSCTDLGKTCHFRQMLRFLGIPQKGDWEGAGVRGVHSGCYLSSQKIVLHSSCSMALVDHSFIKFCCLSLSP